MVVVRDSVCDSYSFCCDVPFENQSVRSFMGMEAFEGRSRPTMRAHRLHD